MGTGMIGTKSGAQNRGGRQMNNNIKSVDFGKKDDIQGALESLKRNIKNMIEYACLMAKIRRQSYLAHVDQGFTEDQALELCKNIY